MNKYLGGLLILMIFVSGSLLCLTSCSKSVTTGDKDTTLSVALLTSKNWTFQYVDGVYGNAPIFYSRGGNNNTQSFDSSYFTFLANGTGTLYTNAGIPSSFTWQFADSTNTSLIWNWALPQPVLVTWQNIWYDNGALHFNQSYYQLGNYTFDYQIMIPR
jgi:hypothetical protein